MEYNKGKNDERIREELIAEIMSYPAYPEGHIANEKINEWIAWLKRK